MLSAGNLNTAALTLFLALHLSVPTQLPWLILADPVQSMDEVHIAQFAALLRTLSKEHQRQVIIAVHDRPLFDYLSLELSPAFAGDELITIELAKIAGDHSWYNTNRRSFEPDTAVKPIAA
jgi:DNA repair protein SbcC/Rad50